MTKLVDDRMVDEMVIAGPPGVIGRSIKDKYADRLQRVAFYGAGPGVTAGLDDDAWSDIIAAIHL